MNDLFASGRIVDFIFGLMALETGVLLAYRHIAGRGIATTSLLTNMAAGGGLLLGLRGALTGTPWTWIAVALAFAFAMHLLDLRRRWNRG